MESLASGRRILTVIHRNFAQIDQAAAEYGPFDFLLADLGVSSMQLDDPQRGFPISRRGLLTCV